ncbi:MAG: hypothetical protein LAT67_13660 [Balneolales bacterium]|nr:hypothetical protein [Balneolales bacterium]
MLIVFIPVYSLAAGVSADNNPDSISPENRRALQFGVGSNLTLTSVDNAVFSYKWMKSETRGYRLNLNVFADYDKWERNDFSTTSTNPLSIFRTTEQITFRVNTAAEFDFLRYYHINQRLFLYTAVGPLIQFGYYNRVRKHLDERFADDELQNSEELRAVTQNNNFGIGGSAGLGIEWFVTPQISFSGEYALRIIADYRTSSFRRDRIRFNEQIIEEDQDDTIINTTLEGTGARIRLSVYF